MSAAATSSAVPWRRREIDGGRRRANEGTPAGSSVSLVEMTWTSISSVARRTREMTEPRVASAQRERRLDPSTIWVARSALAKLASASPTSLPAISW